MAITLYENAIFSSGLAAEFLEVSRVKFIEERNAKGISTLSENEQDLLEIKHINLVR